MNKYVPLSDRCREIMLGSLLGDGSISIPEPYANARFSFKHSVKQIQYFRWKVSEMSEISSDKNSWIQELNGKDGFGGVKVRYQSKALPVLTEIHKLVTEGKRKRVSRKWLNQLTPLSLCVWWMDDGSLVSNTRHGVFCTDGFSQKEVEIISHYLLSVWKIKTRISEIHRADRVYYRIYIRSREELMKFLEIIIPHIPIEEMIYKVLIIYKDSNLQQRWISEIASKNPYFNEDTIHKVLQLRKNQLKNFRE